MAKFCPNCGAELTEGARFCGNCGAKFAVEPPPPVEPTPTGNIPQHSEIKYKNNSIGSDSYSGHNRSCCIIFHASRR